MGLDIHCPKCNKPMKVRTSDRPTNTTVRATLFCNNCMTVKAYFMGGIERIEYAHYSTQDPDKPQAQAESEPMPLPKVSQLDLLNTPYLT
ncbi:hypothetical protein [Lonepinella sp. BR2357]|uniref:hypothetical protein n=1 Tax=Lonepinella sp. BR2357 TaxID=3434549 RepID=UPI003F6E40CE